MSEMLATRLRDLGNNNREGLLFEEFETIFKAADALNAQAAESRNLAVTLGEAVARIAELEAALHAERYRVSEGHDSPCYYCGEKCNSFAANPSLWAIPLCHADDPGVMKWHHIGCVSRRLEPRAALGMPK